MVEETTTVKELKESKGLLVYLELGVFQDSRDKMDQQDQRALLEKKDFQAS